MVSCDQVSPVTDECHLVDAFNILSVIKNISVQCDWFMFNKKITLMFCAYTVLDITNSKMNKISLLLYKKGKLHLHKILVN